jgi:DoxX-like protein
MTETARSGRVRAGWTVTALVIAFLTFDGATKVLEVTPVMEACARLGLGPQTVVGIGTLLLVCTALYAVPKTAVLGAILLTGYLGGAVATHVRGGSGLFETVFPIGCGGLAWLGLLLREPRVLRAMVLDR